MQRILSFSFFLFVANQSYSQFNFIEFPRERHLVKVIQIDRPQTKHIEFDSKDVSYLIHPSAKEKSVLLASAPLDDFFLTSPFGFRTDPISGEPKFHGGIDLKANRSKVYSMLHGKVVSVGNDPLLGNFVKVQHGKYESLYGHLSKVLVSPLENVLPGSVLGISGSTGKSTGDHLHLTIKKGKDFINPALFIQMISKLTTKEELISYLLTNNYSNMKSQNELPMKDLEIFGVIKNGKFTIPEKEVHALKNGRMTDIVELTNLRGKDIHIDKLPARLSIVRGEDGNSALRIDPVYKEPMTHPDLSDVERNQLVRRELANLKKSYVDKEGNIQSEIIEYDQRTKQFLSYNPRDIKAPQLANGEELNPQQKKKYKEGETVQLADGTEFQLSPSSPKGIRSNKAGLVLSVMMDGGLSYLLITGIEKMLGKKSQEDKAYSQGYLQAIKEVQKQVERRISHNPNDKDAVRDLNNIKEEYSKISADSPLSKNVRDDFDINKIKAMNSIDTEVGKNPKNRSNDQENDFERDI